MGPYAVRVLLSGAAAGSYVVSRAQPLTVGRAGRARVYDLAASRLHCRIELGQDGGLRVLDLNSTNGTFLNDEVVTRHPLLDGDEIRIGTSAIHVELQQDSEPDLTCAQCGVDLSPSSFLSAGAFERSGQLYCGRCGTRPSIVVPEHLEDELVIGALVAGGFREVERVPLESDEKLYHARRQTLGQPVTLKVLRTDDADKSEIDVFLREARIAARLSHQNVARVLDIGSSGHAVYTVLERVEGQTLLREIRVRRRLAARRALAIGLPLARALAYLHDQRVVHRDVRPANVLVGSEGDVKLIGFRFACPMKELADPDVRHPDPAADETAYMAPEQLCKAASATDRSDIYGFGATLYHAVTGELPGSASVADGLSERAPELPVELRHLIARCLRSDAGERYADARELLRAVEDALRALYGFGQGSSDAIGMLVNFGPGEVLTDTTRRTVADGFLHYDGDGSAFFGRFAGSELVELAQLVDLNSKSGLLEVRAEDGGRGSIHFRRGKAIQARFRDGIGEDAVKALLSLESGRFRLLIQEPAVEPEHELPLSPFLLEIMRIQDESARLPVQRP